MYKKLLKLTDSIIVNSLDFQREFTKMFNVKSVCIYNPLNKKEVISKSKKYLNFSFFKNKSRQLNIINVARFTDQKDHLTLLKAVNLIKNKINFRLLIVGRGVNKIKMLNFINENGLQKKSKKSLIFRITHTNILADLTYLFFHLNLKVYQMFCWKLLRLKNL